MSTPHPELHQPSDLDSFVSELLKELDRVLPRQWPIKEFVHLNLIEAFQGEPFQQAVVSARRYRGARGYLPNADYRRFFREGRISCGDLEAVLDESPDLEADQVAVARPAGALLRREVVLAILTHDITALTPSQFAWQRDERQALRHWQPDVAAEARAHMADGYGNEAQAVAALWQAVLARLGIAYREYSLEELAESARATAGLAHEPAIEEPGAEQLILHSRMRKDASALLEPLFDQVGEGLTLRGLLLRLTGHDILDEIRTLLVPQLGAYLDQGFAAWHGGEREGGLLAFWREGSSAAVTALLDDLPEWRDELELLANDPLQTVVTELQRLGLPQAQWLPYLRTLALELPGWSGMFLWLHQRPAHPDTPVRVEMMEYLALRLVLERIFARRLCRRLWRVDASLDMLRWYFRRRRSELFARYALHNSRLPEDLVAAIQRLSNGYAEGSEAYAQWQQIANRVWSWQQNPLAAVSGHSVCRSGWRLFLLAQHLGLHPSEVSALSDNELNSLFALLDMDEDATGYLWLQAYERHYSEQLFTALTANHGRGEWAERRARPEAQLVFCMDDREEAFRRHLEENHPAIETFGAAGFFGVPIYWQGLDDSRSNALCPIVVSPSHTVREVAVEEGSEQLAIHRSRRSLRLRLKGALFDGSRRSVAGSALLPLLTAPLALLTLATKLVAPRFAGTLTASLRKRFDTVVATRAAITATSTVPATPQQPRDGFTDEEQANQVFNFLRNIGLRSGFAPLVVMVGHGSSSENNPHRASYDCGACSGRHGGPNARVFSAMANRPEVRALLRQRGVEIPDDTWFIGTFHDTCSEAVEWFDGDLVPEALRERYTALRRAVDEARHWSAYERCRRLPGAPLDASLEQALRHVQGRALDFAQPRAEFGHANNACAIIGRRSVSRAAFFDRRAFLISYDPLQDPEGNVLEPLLLANGPVGAGINLDYYFSAADNEGYGSGSKVTHNVSGMVGVMHGTSDDLRTGLPKQGIDYHEPMRLLVVVEHSIEVVERIYLRQPPLQELIGNGWLLLAVKDPHSSAIHRFVPERGWVRWEGRGDELPLVESSVEWFRGKREPLAPVLTRRGAAAGGAA